MGFCTAAELRDVLGMKASAAADVAFDEVEGLRGPLRPALATVDTLVCDADEASDGCELPSMLPKPCTVDATDGDDGGSVLTWLERLPLGLSTLTGERGAVWSEVSPRKGCLEPVGRRSPFMQERG